MDVETANVKEPQQLIYDRPKPLILFDFLLRCTSSRPPPSGVHLPPGCWRPTMTMPA